MLSHEDYSLTPETLSPLGAEIDQFDPSAISSKGLVFLGDEMIVYRRSPDAPTHPLFLDVPGGRTEESETPYETYSREVMEEFGIQIDRKSIMWAKKYELSDRPSKSVYFLVASLPHKTIDDIVFGDEGIEYMMMPPEDFLKENDIHQPFKDRTQDYLNSINQ